jgi:hypothetical protein
MAFPTENPTSGANGVTRQICPRETPFLIPGFATARCSESARTPTTCPRSSNALFIASRSTPRAAPDMTGMPDCTVIRAIARATSDLSSETLREPTTPTPSVPKGDMSPTPWSTTGAASRSLERSRSGYIFPTPVTVHIPEWSSFSTARASAALRSHKRAIRSAVSLGIRNSDAISAAVMPCNAEGSTSRRNAQNSRDDKGLTVESTRRLGSASAARSWSSSIVIPLSSRPRRGTPDRTPRRAADRPIPSLSTSSPRRRR